eukprot:CAMPEP_0175044222 /NCGR_PEP_ID=MMETSP0052_2-20121109/3675_1 /TAXON_ID=51329 ORGANISM="Polytomella parva, Strain SAG 63-3" /NCGR_SAMPLE_ID=MMETSP0052_2 /ASSEMBLY_ACC=CAM_ASM_000194 /LENGTH=90 /DNA_ID=CAMNT_0016307473 /DNA_START=23 /DNA_END=291 /DNA_ORIENTATION=-
MGLLTPEQQALLKQLNLLPASSISPLTRTSLPLEDERKSGSRNVSPVLASHPIVMNPMITNGTANKPLSNGQGSLYPLGSVINLSGLEDG